MWQSLADFNASMRMTKVLGIYIFISNRKLMTDKAWEKYIGIWKNRDPQRRIGSFREKERINVLKKWT